MGSKMVDFSEKLRGASRHPDQSFDEFLASDPSEEFRNRGNSEKGNEMITLQRAQTPSETSASPRGVQFLKPQHVPVYGGKIGEIKARVYKVTTDKPDGFGNPVIVYFQAPGQKYSKSFKLTSDNLAALVGFLGEDETKWAGKPVTISKTVNEDGERLTFSK